MSSFNVLDQSSEKRYQVFVSSTFKDLEEERQEVMHALLELGCLPAGMELFPAANDTQWNLIKKVIEDSDYYVLIIGGRYGSLGPEGQSYTEMEYRYALSIGKPTIAFLHRDPGKIITNKSETTEEARRKLAAFRSLAEKKLCKHWDTPHELGSVVSRSLIQLIRTTPATGWVRADKITDREATLELLQLRRRVDELEAEIAATRTEAPRGAEGLASGEELQTIHYTFGYLDRATYTKHSYNHQGEFSWNRIFSSLAPLMINEADEDTLRGATDDLIMAVEAPKLYEMKALKGKDLKDFSITEDDFQTIKIQLRALGLIAKSDKQRSVKDSGTYWTLTPYGDEVMTRLRAIKSVPLPRDGEPPSIEEIIDEVEDTAEPHEAREA